MEKLNIHKTGVYAIINDDSKIVYIGETNRSFLVRWVEHLSCEKTWSNSEKVKLFLDINTNFKIICLINNYGRGAVFLATERYYSELYQNLGYKVINQFSKKFRPWSGIRKTKTRKERKKEIIVSSELQSGYKKAFKLMVNVLAEKNNIATLDIYKWSYNMIEKNFGNSFYARNGDSILNKLNLEELEYITLKLFPKYKDYIINSKREYFKNLSEDEYNAIFCKKKIQAPKLNWCTLKILNTITKDCYIIQKRLTNGNTVDYLIEKISEKYNVDNDSIYKVFGIKNIRKYVEDIGLNNIEFSYKLNTEEHKNDDYLEFYENAKKQGKVMNKLNRF